MIFVDSISDLVKRADPTLWALPLPEPLERDSESSKALLDLDSDELWAQLKIETLKRMGPTFGVILLAGAEAVSTSKGKKFNPYHDAGGRFSSRGTYAANYAELNDAGAQRMLDRSYEQAQSMHRSLTPEELAAVDVYKADGHEVINPNLRKGYAVTSADVSQIDSACQKFILPEAVTATRVLSPEIVGEIRAMKVGDYVTDKAFVSTSLSQNFGSGLASEFGLGMVRIRISAGSNGIPTDAIPQLKRKWLDMTDQGEWTLPRNSVFRVVGTGEVPVLQLVGTAK